MLLMRVRKGEILFGPRGEIIPINSLEDTVKVEFNNTKAKKFLIGNKIYVPEKHTTKDENGKKVKFFGVKPYEPSRIRKKAMAGGLTAFLTFGTPALMLANPKPGPDIFSIFKKKKKKAKKPAVEPVDIDIYDSRGGLIEHIEDLTWEQAKKTPLFVPYNGSLVFYEQKAGKFESDVALNYNNQKVRNPDTRETIFRPKHGFVEIEFIKLNLPEGAKGYWTYQLENGLYIASSLKGIFKYGFKPKVPPTPEILEEPELPEPRIPPPVIALPEEVPLEEPVMPSFSIKGAYILESENSKIEIEDPARTGKGLLGEMVYAGKNYQMFITGFWLGYDDKFIVPGWSQLRNVFSEINIGAEYKILGSTISPVISGEFIHTNNEYVPTRTPLWTPPMNKYTYNGFFVGAGLAVGNLNESFLEGLICYGKGNLEEKINLPGRYYLDDFTIHSQGLTEWFYKVHGKLINDTIFLEGTGSWGGYDDIEKTLNGLREIYSGKLGVSLGVILDKLKRVYIGGFYHHSHIKDNNVDFSNDIFGPVIILYLGFEK